MIGNGIYKYCSDDITKIENFNEAINDRTQTWVIHHRLEIQGDNVCTQQDLKDRGLYYNRPASELIFLTCSEHSRLHSANHTVWNKRAENSDRRKPSGFT